MAKERRATLQPVPGQTGQAAAGPARTPARAKSRTGNALYVVLPPELKRETDVVAAMLQVPLNVLVAALLKEHVSRDRADELSEVVQRYGSENRES